MGFLLLNVGLWIFAGLVLWATWYARNLEARGELSPDVLTITAEAMEPSTSHVVPGRFTFASVEGLLRTINVDRWALLSALAGAGALGVRELAYRVGRDGDEKGVNSDANALVDCGLLKRDHAGALLLPFQRVRVDFGT